MAFTPQDVKTLRDKTGCGMMDCKKALTEADGVIEKAIEILREKGLSAAAKKSDRVAAEGIVFAKTTAKMGVIVEVNSETDFVAKNQKFRDFVTTVADTIIANNPKDVAELMTMKAVDSNETITEMLNEKIATIGEKLEIRRFVKNEGNVVSYIHGGGTHGVLVDFAADAETADKEEFITLGKDIAMHITATNPLYLQESDIPAEVVEKEKEILTTQALNEGKPANIAEKMVIGRIKKYLKDICLLDQEFVKNPDLSILQHVNEVAKSLGSTISINSFTRYEIGEGIEKKEDNFADEVASMVN